MQFIDSYIKNPIIDVNVGIVLIKNEYHEFVAANQVFLNISGVDHIDKLIGLTDEDMPWAGDSSIYVEHEKKVMKGFYPPVIEPLNGIQNVQLITDKKCVYDSKENIVGTMAQAILLPREISYQGLLGNERTLVKQPYDDNLTRAETRIIYLLLKAKKRAVISAELGISVRTYDYHINNIKIKLSVNSMIELVERCLELKWNEKYPF